MEELEVSAKSVDEAIELALDQLGLTRSEVSIEVVQEGKRSILGLGGENAIVKVIPMTPSITSSENAPRKTDPDTAATTARQVLEKLIELMDVPGSVEVLPPEDNESPVTLEINTENPGVLIGRRGQALSALQYMVNFLSSRELKSGVKVILDVAGYRKRRRDELQSMAIRIADMVKTNRRAITLEPMVAWERRIVHLALHEENEITTGSVGYGERRKVVVSLRK